MTTQTGASVSEPFPGRYMLAGLPEGDAGTMATVHAMRAVARDAAERSPRLRLFAAHLYDKDQNVRLRNVYRFLAERVIFRRDPPGLETIIHPENMLAQVQARGFALGDCDDRATLGAALHLAMADAPAFVIMARRAASPFEHVFYAVRQAGAWVPADPQERFPLGVWPPAQRRHIEAV